MCNSSTNSIFNLSSSKKITEIITFKNLFIKSLRNRAIDKEKCLFNRFEVIWNICLDDHRIQTSLSLTHIPVTFKSSEYFLSKLINIIGWLILLKQSSKPSLLILLTITKQDNKVARIDIIDIITLNTKLQIFSYIICQIIYIGKSYTSKTCTNICNS